jgi:hypothetical protein
MLIDVRRLALTRQQVRRYRLPPNFAKETDTRYMAYVVDFGRECWELDALRPDVISNLIRTELESQIDHKLWDKAKRQERRSRKLLERVAANWPKVQKLVAR